MGEFSFRMEENMYEYGFIFYCNREVFRNTRDYFLGLFLNCAIATSTGDLPSENILNARDSGDLAF
jgi:hypothetical protein